MSLNNNLIGVKENTKASPKELFFKYLIYLPLFALILALSISAAYTYLRYTVPMYSSSLSLLVKNDTKTSGADALADNLGFGTKKANLANEIEILKSASIMAKVIDTLNLNLQYFSTGKVKRTEMYGNCPFVYTSISPDEPTGSFTYTLKFDKNKNFQIAEMSNSWHKSGQILRVGENSFKIDIINPIGIYTESTYYVQWRPINEVALDLSYALSIKQLSREASILKLSIQTEVPKKGRDVLNQLVNEYNRSTIEDKNRIIDNTLKFVDDRLFLLTGELGKVEQGLQTYKQSQQVVNIEMQGASKYSAMLSTEGKLNEQEIKVRMINMVRDYVNNSVNRPAPVLSSLGIEDPTLGSLVQQYNQLQLKWQEDLQSTPEANFGMQQLKSKIESLRTSILENLKSLESSLQSVRNKTLGEYNDLRGNLRTVPSKEKDLLEITRQQGIKQNLFLFLLQKREESAITRASAVASSYALDPAISMWTPITPDKSSIYRMAIILGLIIPIGIIYIIDLLKDKIITRQDIVKATNVPILGEIAHHPEKNRQWVVGVQDRSVLSEQFRIIRTNLQYFISNKKNPVLLITSTIAGEGKTFTSMNIGAVWAVANKKTVILELDLRKPKISAALNLENYKGISNYMLGQVKMEELPTPIKGLDNLYIIPAGPIPPNPSELLMDSKIDDLFAYLKENFDLIVIDSAPVSLVSDTKILSRFADATLYLVRQRYTLKKQLNFIDDLYNNKVLPSMGLLVNDVKMGGMSSYYGYGYGYGYSSNYSYNYGNEQKLSWVRRLINYYK